MERRGCAAFYFASHKPLLWEPCGVDHRIHLGVRREKEKGQHEEHCFLVWPDSLPALPGNDLSDLNLAHGRKPVRRKRLAGTEFAAEKQRARDQSRFTDRSAT